MERRTLGETGLVVSRLCFGALTLSRLQAGLRPTEGARLMAMAHALGVNFFDTAELYDNYEHFRLFLREVDRPQVILATKAYAYDAVSLERSLGHALRSMGTDYIDLFMLHEQESAETLEGHREALEALVRAKEAGAVRATGISTHSPAAVLAAARRPEVDVIMAIMNARGIGIRGSAQEMHGALSRARAAGKGICLMKVLGGGTLLQDVEAALGFALDLPYADAVAVGIKSRAELEMDVALFEGRPVSPAVLEELRHATKELVIEPTCSGCALCVQACGQGALELVAGKVRVDRGRCVLCGYCVGRCPEMSIAVV